VPIVEAARAVVLLQHPEVAAGRAPRAEPIEYLVVEPAPDASGPDMGHDVQPVEPVRPEPGQANRPRIHVGYEHRHLGIGDG
jgi:hypothetical protein